MIETRTPTNAAMICPRMAFLGCANGELGTPYIRTADAPNEPIISGKSSIPIIIIRRIKLRNNRNNTQRRKGKEMKMDWGSNINTPILFYLRRYRNDYWTAYLLFDNKYS